MVLQMQLIAIAIGAFKKFAEIYYFNIMWHKYYLFLQTLRKKPHNFGHQFSFCSLTEVFLLPRYVYLGQETL